MIDLAELAAYAHPDLDRRRHHVEPLRVGARLIDTDQAPALQAVVNLSTDSTYRTSIAPDHESALRKATIAMAEGADFVDIGAESTAPTGRRVGAAEQIQILLPVVKMFAAAGIPMSVESYEVEVIKACVAAGAQIVNLTGSQYDDEVFAVAADAGATVLLCYAPQANVKEDSQLPSIDVGLGMVLDNLGPRVDRARELGVTSLAVDPGIGFSFTNLATPVQRIRVQSHYLLHSAALRKLGVPVLQSLPNAFPIFQEHYRQGESYFAVLALLGGAGVLRVHETGPVRAVAATMGTTLP